MTTELDALDIRILSELQADASLHLVDLAERVGSSKSVCWRRIQRFQSDGIIAGRVTILDAEKLGFGVMVLAFVKISRGEVTMTDFIAALQKIPEVIECHALMGDVDLMLKIVVPSMRDYEQLLWSRFSNMPGVTDIRSSISLTRFVNTTKLPLSALPHSSGTSSTP